MTAADEIERILSGLTPDERARLKPRLDRVLIHRRALTRFPTPAHLGQLFRPGWLQTPMLDAIDNAVMSALSGEHLRWIINTPPQEGKLVAHATPVPTPDGWKQHGDLRVGDCVFHPSGAPTRVTHIGAVAPASLRVHFSDHATVKVHPRHEWTVWDRDSKRWRTVDTEYLAQARLRDGAGGRYRFQLPTREAFQLPDAPLPVDPYTLGVWLGDGNTAKGNVITHHPNDRYDLAYSPVSEWVHPLTGIVNTRYDLAMKRDLAAAGVLGNKHIPPAYLRASVSQRRALLAGLIDTDGHAGAAGQVSFDNTDRALVHQVAELLRTLGYRAHVHRPTAARLSSSGVQGRKPMWRVTYTPHDVPPARLPRKVNRVGTRRRVAVIAVTEETSEPGRCITVDAADGMYLVGEHCTPTHNTSRLQDAGAWLLLNRPWLRIAYASYEQGVAAQSGLAIRQMYETHGSGYQGATADPEREDVLGLLLDPNRGMQTNWALADVPGRKGMRPGGVLSVGIGSSFTGRPADVLIVDDPLKDAKAADSPVIRKTVKDWFQSVASARLSSGAIVIIIQTRWHEDDLTGWLIGQDSARAQPRYRHLNVPAQAEHPNAPGRCLCRDCYDGADVLGRAPGEYLLSARGRTDEDWRQIREDVGERWWFALYQGRPSPPEGGIFQRAWFDRNRVLEPPELVYVATFVDPADNQGDGDEAGIVTGGVDTAGDIHILSDDSGHYTVARWVRVAIFAMLRHGSSRLMYEQSLSGLKRAIAGEWKAIRAQARALAALGDVDDWSPGPDLVVVDAAVRDLADDEDTEVDRRVIGQALVELWPYVPRVLSWPVSGPPIKSVKPLGTKTFRAEMVSPLYEQGRVHHVGAFVTLEHQMATWLPTQDSPDRMDAAVHLVTKLSETSGSGRIAGAPADRQLPARQRRVPTILRTTRTGR